MADTTSIWSFTAAEVVGILGHQLEVGPLVPSGEITYITPIDPAGYIASYLGADSEEPIIGWKWDDRIWSSEEFENDLNSIPINTDASTSGLQDYYFQSGIGSNIDLELQNIIPIHASGLNTLNIQRIWAPEVLHGWYYDYQYEHYLFSDDSVIRYVEYSGVNPESLYAVDSGFNSIVLEDNPKTSIPVRAQQFEWNDVESLYEVVKAIRRVTYFTGTKESDGSRLDTWNDDSGRIIWDNVDRTVDEFTILESGSNPYVVFNKQYSEEVAQTPGYPGEFLGYSDGSVLQEFHLKYSPVDRTTGILVRSYLTDVVSGQVWQPIALDQTISGYQVRVDYDLGLLRFGDTAVSGIEVPAAGDKVVCNYRKTIALEYEPENTIDTVLGHETSVNPIYRQNSGGFIYLGRREEDPASIVLTSTLPLLQTNYYGPLAIGNAFAPLIATVKDAKGNVLEDQAVTFFITSTPVVGGFSGASSVIGVTGPEGEAKTYYNPPRGISDMGEYITASDWSVDNSPTGEFSAYTQITKLHTQDLVVSSNVDDIFLYEVYVDDPLLGVLDTTLNHSDIDAQLTEYYKDFFDENQIWGPTGMPVPASGVWEGEPAKTPTDEAITWEDTHRTIWGLPAPSIFQTSAGMGRKKIVAALDGQALNPHTFSSGAVSPVQPIAVIASGEDEYDVIYNTSNIDLAKPTGTDTIPSGSFYSYFLVSPSVVTVQASVYNARLKKTITSNEISLRLTIPSYLSGLWIIDAINQNHINEISSVLSTITANNQKVPLGFRLRSSNVTLAAAIGGVTFLDVNRQYNYDPYDEDDLSMVLGQKFRVYPVT